MKDYAEELAELAAGHFDAEEDDEFIENFAKDIRRRINNDFVARQRELELNDG